MIKRLAAAAGLVALSFGAAAAEDVAGVWRTETNDDGHWALVEIYPCGDEVCGTMVDTNAADRSNVGIQMIKDMEVDGARAWDDGEIFAPDDDEWYDADMKLLADGRLEVSGCVLGGLVCRSQVWTRE